MKKNIFSKLMVAGLTLMAIAACGEPDDEITSINYGRNFSPTDVKASVRNRTNVELSWTIMDGIQSYNVEVFQNDSLTFSGSPVKSFTVSPEEVPYTITGLEGETPYSFRVQAISDKAADSKWTGAYAKTDSEQIFYSVAEDDIKGRQVTLRWPAGEEAATITLNPGNIVYTITAADIAAGAATITGLTPETDYTAVMTRASGKTRGKISFKTGIDLADTDILVKAGEDLAAAVANAPEGYRLVLESGEYNIARGGDTPADFGGSLKITKKLGIKGLSQSDHPVIKGRIEVQADLDIDQVALDGTGTDGGQCFNFNGEANIDHFSITNSEISNYTKGFFYLNVAIVINTINIDGCVISNIECSGGDLFDSRAGGYNTFNLTNSTIYNSAKSRDVFRMDDASSAVSASPVVKVDHCTFSGVGNGGANYRFFYLRFAGNKISFTNNIVTDFNNKRGFTNQSSTDAEPTLDNNVYFNTQNLMSLADGNTEKVTWFDEKGTELDPQFKDAANGDFTLQNDNVKDLKVGDPRWY